MPERLFFYGAPEVARDARLMAAITKLLAWCQANDWAGYDPYDALNSRLLKTAPFLDARIPRLALTQALKRFPVNLRRLLWVEKKQNAKAIALFLSSLLNLQEAGEGEYEDGARLLLDRLVALRSPGNSYWCWGYSFPWQTRTVLVPAGAPNLVCTVFVAGALLDASERLGDAACLEMARSAGEYLLNELYWSEGGAAAGFCYPLPGVRARVHNANLLAAALLCRLSRHTGEERFLSPALRAARYAASKQEPDGSWFYGEAGSQRWIDNFHSGYNLCALQSIARDAETSEFNRCICRGLEFYCAHFFRPDGAARYFHDRNYPVDAHAVAQSIITLAAFNDLNSEYLFQARRAFHWAMDHLWDRRGFFYYRVLRSCTIRIPYMRWSQAWMLLAMTALLLKSKSQARRPQTNEAPALAGGAHD